MLFNYKKISTLVLGITMILGTSCFNSESNAEESNKKESVKEALKNRKYKGYMTAPDFTTGLDWINTSKPISLKDLKGKFVILDFWTYGCINCMHIIPDLKKLEATYKDELVVIGVHSAKFDNEKKTENIKKIVQRYGIKHPVVNDKDFKIWNNYAAQAWPAIYVITPEGKVFEEYLGEGFYSDLNKKLKEAIKEADSFHLIDRKKIEFNETVEQKSLLSFPGKIFVDSKNNNLFVSDSGNNRILIFDLKTNKLKTTIGSGEEGLKDGSFKDAKFRKPQGLFSTDNKLYVADTENHAVREIDLKNETVNTLIGTGKQAPWKASGGKGKNVELSSPWDVLILNNQLYIAMAGSHQIWNYNFETQETSVFAGTGAEHLVDGLKGVELLAQPSGLTTDGNKIYFADSESSAIRELDTSLFGGVSTLVGTGLFDFGDKDGSFEKSLLQHPLGVSFYKNKLYVADTYNSKIKELDLSSRKVKTYLTGLNEPGGIFISEDNLYIADTNNNSIKQVNLKNKEVKTLISK
jgi:DNA-binding beta-propeller fold protein YncE